MTTKRTVIEENDAADREQEARELAELNTLEDGALFNVTDELRTSAGVSLMIFCLAPPEKEGYVADMPVSEFSHARMRKLYGPGRYRIRIKGPKGFLPGGGAIKIAEVASDVTPPTDLAGLLELMDRKERERKEASNDKWNRILELSIPVLGTALSAWIARGGGSETTALIAALKPAPGPTLADLAATMVNMKALTAPADSAKDPLDQITRVMEIVKGMNDGDSGGGAGRTNWLDVLRDVIKEAGPALSPLMGAVLQSRGRMPAGVPLPSGVPVNSTAAVAPPAQLPRSGISAPASPLSVAATAESHSVNSIDPMLKMFMPVIREHLQKVAQWAVEDRNPVTYAELFLDEIPSNFASVIPQNKALEYVNDPRWFEAVCDIQPIFKGYKTWCEEFRAELIDLLKVEIPPPDAGDGPTAAHPMVGE